MQAKRKYQEAQGQVRSLQGDNDELRTKYAQKAQYAPSCALPAALWASVTHYTHIYAAQE